MKSLLNCLKRLLQLPNSGGRQHRRKSLRVLGDLEGLETRLAPASFTLSGGIYTYTANSGVANNMSVSVSGTSYTINETGPSETTPGSLPSGWTSTPISGGFRLTGPLVATDRLVFLQGDGADRFSLLSATNALTVNTGSGTNSVTLGGAVGASAGNLGSITANVAITSTSATGDSITFLDTTASVVATQNQNVVISESSGLTTVAGLLSNTAGVSATLTYDYLSTVASLVIRSSNSSTQEKFTLQGTSVTATTLLTGGGNDTVTIAATRSGSSTTVDAGLGNDVVTVGSTATGVGLVNIDGPVFVSGGSGTNTLTLENTEGAASFGYITNTSGTTTASLASGQLGAISYATGLFATVTVNLSNDSSSGDLISINSASPALTVNGQAGSDYFLLGQGTGAPGVVGAKIDGGAGSDSLSLGGSAASNVTLTAAATNGFSGLNAGNGDTAAFFSNIDTLARSGGGGTLSGLDTTATWNLSGLGSTYVVSQTLSFNGFTTLNGGSAADTFSFGGGPAGYTLAGNGGTDSLQQTNDVTLTGFSTGNGFAGTASGQATFTGIDDAVGASGMQTLTGTNTESSWILDGARSEYSAFIGGNDEILTFAGFNTLHGGSGVDFFIVNDITGGSYALAGNDGEDTFDLVSVNGSALSASGGNGDDVFNVNSLDALSNGASVDLDGGDQDTSTGDTLNVTDTSDADTVWTIDGIFSSNISTSFASLNYTNIETLGFVTGTGSQTVVIYSTTGNLNFTFGDGGAGEQLVNVEIGDSFANGFNQLGGLVTLDFTRPMAADSTVYAYDNTATGASDSVTTTYEVGTADLNGNFQIARDGVQQVVLLGAANFNGQVGFFAGDDPDGVEVTVLASEEFSFYLDGGLSASTELIYLTPVSGDLGTVYEALGLIENVNTAIKDVVFGNFLDFSGDLF